MSEHRRRAENFTDSLSSFIDSDINCSVTEDSINEMGNTGLPVLRTLSAPDLNKRINLFEAQQLYFKEDENKENFYNCTAGNSTSKKLTKTGASLNRGNRDSNIDSNHNIENKSNTNSVPQRNVPKITSIFQLVPLLKFTNANKKNCDTNCQSEHLSNEAEKFKTALRSLDKELNRTNEVSRTEKVLKRLSDRFVDSPKNFTEKLLTIIEESVINDDEDNDDDNTGVDLSRLTTEFRKLCKFKANEPCIANQSPPKWPESPVSPPLVSQVSAGHTCNSNQIIDDQDKNLHSPSIASVLNTPFSAREIMKRRFLNKIAGNMSNRSIHNESVSSNNASFEALEALCKDMFPEEQKEELKSQSKCLRRSMSLPNIMSMTEIHNICNEQLASLEEDDIKKHMEINQNSLGADENELELSDSFLKELNDTKNIQADLESRKSNANHELDEFEKTLLQNIAEKRKRCLDTVRLLMEINADTTQAQGTSKTSPVSENSLNSSNNETKFMQTLKSCEIYQTYLEKQKPLFKLFRNSKVNTMETNMEKMEETEKCKKIVDLEKKSSNTEEMKKKNGTPKSGPKKKYFFTPEKTPPAKDPKKKRIYFPTLHDSTENTGKFIMKSPNAKGLYRCNYNTVLSPVGMYIRGTDTALIKKIHPKSSPNIKSIPKIIVSPSTPMKNSTPKEKFALPKVFYKLPHSVKTINENLPHKNGSRINKLTEAVQSRRVIRHEGRTMDESLHVERAANRTNFLRKNT